LKSKAQTHPSRKCVTLATPEKYANVQMLCDRFYLQFTSGVATLNNYALKFFVFVCAEYEYFRI